MNSFIVLTKHKRKTFSKLVQYLRGDLLLLTIMNTKKYGSIKSDYFRKFGLSSKQGNKSMDYLCNLYNFGLFKL